MEDPRRGRRGSSTARGDAGRQPRDGNRRFAAGALLGELPAGPRRKSDEGRLRIGVDRRLDGAVRGDGDDGAIDWGMSSRVAPVEILVREDAGELPAEWCGRMITRRPDVQAFSREAGDDG